MKLSIIIVHYKTYDLTLRCIRSVYASTTDLDYEIIVVDNDSQDGAGEKITSEFQEINWVYNTSNAGFGRANNLGVTRASGEFLLFLNSDMLVPEKSITTCLAFIQENTTVGVLGPKLLNEDGSFQKSAYTYVGDHQEILKDNLFLDKIHQFKTPSIKAIMGSFMVIPKELFEKVNGFDPDFFMYCEELDLCERIHELGYSIHYLETVTAIHKHGGSSTASNWSSRQTYLSRSLLVYKRKGLLHYFISHALYHFNFITNFFLMWLLDKNYRKAYWVDARSYFSNWLTYWTIPFTFTRKLGSRNKLLKSA